MVTPLYFMGIVDIMLTLGDIGIGHTGKKYYWPMLGFRNTGRGYKVAKVGYIALKGAAIGAFLYKQ